MEKSSARVDLLFLRFAYFSLETYAERFPHTFGPATDPDWFRASCNRGHRAVPYSVGCEGEFHEPIC